MSDVERDGLTTDQPVAPDQEEQTQPEMEGQSVEQAEEGIQVPEKFMESSKIDLIKAYQELEKERGRLASELGNTRKEREEIEEKYRQIELSQPQTQPSPQQSLQQVPEEKIEDPLSVFDSKFDEDPKGAIREALLKQYENIQSQNQVQRMQEQSVKAAEYYNKQKSDNPDFARRESAMQQLAQQFGHIIKPEYANSADTIKALDLMSRGMDINYYTKAAIEEAQKRGASVLEEKRRAQSVSSHSEGEDSVNLSKLSNEEYLKAMQELYGYAQKD